VTDTERHLNLLLARSVWLLRVAAGMTREVERRLEELHKELVAMLAASDLPANMAYVTRRGYEDIGRWLSGQFINLQESQRFFLYTELGQGLIDRWEVLGLPLERWIDRLAENERARVEALASRRLDLETAIEELSSGIPLRRFESLIKTAVMSLASSIVIRSFNWLDIQWQQISVLDNRTTQVCQDYAFKVWNAKLEPVGHSLPFNGGPPRHWHCRSILLPLMDGKPVEEMSFKQWFDGLSDTAQDETFGVKAKLFRSGKVPAADLFKNLRPAPLPA